jgi:DNA-binding NarL/FixJ family response regulator
VCAFASPPTSILGLGLGLDSVDPVAERKALHRNCSPRHMPAPGDIERAREERDNSIRELRDSGWSIRDIASMLDCSMGTVFKAIHA